MNDYTKAIQALRLDDRTTEFLRQLHDYVEAMLLERMENGEPEEVA